MPTRKAAIKGQGNQKLQEERLRRGWTQQEVANRVGTTVVNVSRWERGVTSPGPYFRQQLSTLFAKDADALGFGSDESSDMINADTRILSASSAADEQAQQQEVQPIIVVSYPELDEGPEPVAGILAGQSMPLEVSLHPPARRKARWIIGLSVACILLIISNVLLFPRVYTRTASNAHDVSPVSKQSTPTLLRPLLMYSFEDGGTDGWTKEGHIVQFQNSNAVDGYDGTRTLQVVFSSRQATDLPYISVNPVVDAPRSGETISAAVFVPSTTTTIVIARFYVQDIMYTWHLSPSMLLTTGKWNILRFIVPRFAGPSLQVGIQFLTTPFNVLTTLYVDAVEWW